MKRERVIKSDENVIYIHPPSVKRYFIKLTYYFFVVILNRVLVILLITMLYGTDDSIATIVEARCYNNWLKSNLFIIQVTDIAPNGNERENT